MIPGYSFNLTTKPPHSMVILGVSAIIQNSWSAGKRDSKLRKKNKIMAEYFMKFVLPLAYIEGPCKLQFKN